MMRLIAAAFAGGLFGAGLLISGMTNPAKVQGWLDIFGDWDPTLGFVLGGAMLPMLIAWRIAARQGKSLIGGLDLPEKPSELIDARLIGGAALFGLGWGLSGLCPGPTMASLGFGGVPIWLFFASMVAGMVIYRRVRPA